MTDNLFSLESEINLPRSWTVDLVAERIMENELERERMLAEFPQIIWRDDIGDQGIETSLLSRANERLRDITYELLSLEDGDGIREQLKTGFWELKESFLDTAPQFGKALVTVGAETKDLFTDRSKQIIATGVAIGVLAVGVNAHQGNGVELAAGETITPALVIESDEIGYYVPFEVTDEQDVALSIEAAAKASGVPSEKIQITDNRLYYAIDASPAEAQIYAGYVAATAPDSKMEVVEKPIEQMTDGEFIDWLVNKARPSAEEYEVFDVDTSRKGVFADEMTGNKIKPTAFVGHWTAGLYDGGVDQFVSAIKNREGNCCSVMYFMSKDAQVYRFSASWEQTAHAFGANDFTQGVEIEARNLKDYTPEQMKAFLYLALRFMSANDIPIERQNFLGHAEVDETHGRKQKIDMPPELVDKLFPLLKQLSEEVYLKAQTPNQNPGTNVSPDQRYSTAMDTLLTEIASHEGGWDSVNTGVAGDTKFAGERYRSIFGDRTLSQVTIKEVLDLQAADRLFAVGRYQFIPGTLRSAVESTGIDQNRLFDPAAQNELAINYLIMGGKRQTLAGYIRGENDDIAGAIDDACMEWASLPCFDGNGYYDGDSAGNNAAGGAQRVEEMRALLDELRAAHAAKQQPAPATPLRDVVFVGDSLTVGMDRHGDLQQIDEQYGMNVSAVNARIGRALEAGDDNGMDAVRAMTNEISEAEVVYLGLGTNAIGSNEAYEETLRGALDLIPDNKAVVIPRIYSNIQKKDSRNEIIERVASEMGAHVIDQGGVVELANDDVHATNYSDIANFTLKTMSTIPTPEQPAPEEPATTTTTMQPTTTTVEGEDLVFDRQTTLHIYEPYFRKSDGSIDLVALDAWLSKLPSQTIEGEIKYKVSINNIPEINEGEA